MRVFEEMTHALERAIDLVVLSPNTVAGTF
jgi:hypothetical protein